MVTKKVFGFFAFLPQGILYLGKIMAMQRPHIFAFKQAKARAREFRRNPTDSERLLWKQIRNRKLGGYKFLRQHPVIYRSFSNRSDYFIADFYCDLKKVVIELDGPIHNETTEYDDFRDSEMENLGLNVLRLKNEELNNLKETLKKILTFMDALENRTKE